MRFRCSIRATRYRSPRRKCRSPRQFATRGRLGFSAKDGAATDGITGPLVVLIEAPGKAGDTIDGELKRITKGNGRALVATIACADLVVDVQMYFGPDPAEGEYIVKPYMTTTAQSFVDNVKRQCAE